MLGERFDWLEMLAREREREISKFPILSSAWKRSKNSPKDPFAGGQDGHPARAGVSWVAPASVDCILSLGLVSPQHGTQAPFLTLTCARRRLGPPSAIQDG